jgi:hypothetical protein
MYGVNGLAGTNAAARCKWDQQLVEVRCWSKVNELSVSKSGPLHLRKRKSTPISNTSG